MVRLIKKVSRIKRVSKKLGLPPGTLVHIGEQKVEQPRITVIDYDEGTFNERRDVSVDECAACKDTPRLAWINLDGLHDVRIIERLGECFGLHPLLLEDILNTDQRPKMEDHEDYLYVTLRMLSYDDAAYEIKSEQVSLIIGRTVLLSFQEREGDVFNQIRDRLRNGKGRVRRMGADYLAYALIDAIVDYYFVVLEKLGERIEDLETELLENPTSRTIETIHKLKREMVFLRRSVWPLREVISALERSESGLVHDTTDIYLRDVYDHTIQVIETVETHRDILSGMLDIYLSSVSNRMNEVMKVLTIIATIFIPLTLVAGIYGMNFKYMPELEWPWGYFGVLGVMVVLAGVMLVYFKKKRWI